MSKPPSPEIRSAPPPPVMKSLPLPPRIVVRGARLPGDEDRVVAAAGVDERSC